MMILTKNIKEYCAERKETMKQEIAAVFPIGSAPVLAVVQVGNNEASNRYIKHKKKDCEEVGIKFEWYGFDESIGQDDLIFEIQQLQEHVDGLIV